MRVLVTGHLGYIGVVLVPMLQKRGHEVVGMDSDLYERCTFGPAGQIVDAPNIRKDVRDAERRDVEGFDAVLHLAGLSNDPLGDLNPDLTYEINHRASVRLAELARDAGVGRYVFSSSCSTYGASEAGSDLIDESGAFNPVTPYGESKVFTERDVGPMASDSFTPVFLRNATAYGYSPRLRFDLVVNNLTAWAFTTGRVHLKSDGTPWRPIVHIADISRAFIAVTEAPAEQVRGQAYNIGRTDHNYQIRDIALGVRDVVPGSEVGFADDASPDKRNYRVSCDKFAGQFPEWVPEWDVKRGAAELYAEYKRIGVTLDEFEGPMYRRVDHIRMLIEKGAIDETLRRTR